MLVLRYINLHNNRNAYNTQLLMQLAHIILDFSIYNTDINLDILQGLIPQYHGNSLQRNCVEYDIFFCFQEYIK